MTSAPSAPFVRSRHMKPNRSWPGVPNRYSLISAATSVMAASVVSSGISEITDTAVVLPTPNPPAITIFTGSGGPDPASTDGLESTDDPFDDLRVVVEAGVRPAYGQVSRGDEVTGQHPGHAEVQAETGGELRDRQRPLAEPHDVAVLVLEAVHVDPPDGGAEDLGLDLECGVHRADPTAGEQVWAYTRRGLVHTGRGRIHRLVDVGADQMRVPVTVAHHAQDPTLIFSSSMSCGVRTSPARLANMAISYASTPRFASLVASTPSEEPMLIVLTSR